MELSGEIPPQPPGLPAGTAFPSGLNEDDELPTETLTPRRAEELKAVIAREKRFQEELNIEIHKRRSISLACLSFALIGIPLGISARRRETSNGLLISLFVAAAYFGLLIFAQQIEDAPLSLILTILWLPNALCFIIGIWLFRRASFR